MGASEVSLVQRAKDGDAACFGELFEIHASRTFGAAVSILGNQQDAEEVVQEAAIEAFRSIRQLRADEAFGAWFTRIVVNKAIDRLRRRQREQRRTVSLTELDPPALSGDVEGRMDVANAVAQLPPEHQAIIRLYYTEGYRTPEIARLLDKAEGTIRRQLSEA
ncbi:MAG: RNA polymerase sigma factor, partial [Dehalococcoidia bacterium]